MKKNEPSKPQNPPSAHEDKPGQDNLSQDTLSDEQLEEVSGGATGRRIHKPIMFTTPVGQASPITLD